MLLFGICVFLIILMLLVRKERGPIWSFCISWLVCVLPLATGVIEYMGVDPQTPAFAGELLAFLACFFVGVFSHRLFAGAGAVPSEAVRKELLLRDYRRTLPIAIFCWMGALLATGSILYDFFLLNGAGLDDLTALRDAVTGRDEATVYARISAVLTWCSIYCYCFALLNRRRMSLLVYVFFLVPVGGYFLVAVLSAGRQAAFQIIIFTIIALISARAREGRIHRTPAERRLGFLAAGLLSVTMIGYMGYVAVARNSSAISFDKAEVLQSLFQFKIAPPVDDALRRLGDGMRESTVEGLVYFTNAPAFFSAFLTADWSNRTYGLMSFPFAFRQIQGFTGLNVRDALEDKMGRMEATGALAVGWTTAISSHIMDFGYGGAAVFLFLQGYFASWAWRRALFGADFNEAMIGIVLLVVCVYTPLVPALSDTNVFILFFIVVLMRIVRGTLRPSIRADHHESGIAVSADA